MTLPRPSDRSTAVVTGASSGIGEELARELARRGHGVTLVARSIGKLQTLADEIGTSGVAAHVVGADLSDRGARSQLLARISDLGLEPDILNPSITRAERVERPVDQRHPHWYDSSSRQLQYDTITGVRKIEARSTAR